MPPYSWRGPLRLAPVVRNERGQGATEYVLLIVLVTLGLIPFLQIYRVAIEAYLKPILFFASLPIP